MSRPILPYDGDATALTDAASPMTGQQTEARPKPEVYKGRFKQETRNKKQETESRNIPE